MERPGHTPGAALDALFADYAEHPPRELHIDNLTAIVLRFNAGPTQRENVDETALPTASIAAYL